MPNLEVALLGSFSASLNDAPLKAFRTKAVQALLIYLVCQPDEAHRREFLMSLLWPGLPQKSAQASLRQTIYLLRQAIPEAETKDGRNAAPFLISDRQAIQVNPELAYELDVATFEALLAGPVEGWTEAVDLYRGDFLAGFYLPDSAPFEEWVLARREALRRRVLAALERLAGLALASADYATAEEVARRQIEIDELRENAYRQLMTALALTGRRTDALTHYDKLRQLFENELAAEPSAETLSLYEHILSDNLDGLAQKDQASAPTPQAPLPTPKSPRTSLPAFLQQESKAERERPVFVGREVELERLAEELGLALEGDGRILFVTGDAGNGKTSLMNAFARQASEIQPDLLVAWGVCSAITGRGDPYLPFRHLLAMLTGDVETGWAAGNLTTEQARVLWDAMPAAVGLLLDDGPDLLNTLVPGPALDSRLSARLSADNDLQAYLQQQLAKGQAVPGEMEQPQLFEQVIAFLRHLSEQQPILLFLDDLQWSDQASLNLLFQLGRQLAGSRLLLVGAYRPEEVALGRGGDRHPLEKVTAELKRTFGQITLDLREIDTDRNRAFVEALVDSEPNFLDDSFREQLHALTGGHTLFTVETLRYLQERGDLIQDDSGHWKTTPGLAWDGLPDRVEGIIAERIGRLDDELRGILSVAAVEGERFTAQIVARLQDVKERKVLGLLSRDLEKKHCLVREREAQRIGRQMISRFQFSHALIQQYLYGELGVGERRLLHGEIGAILEELYEDSLDDIAVVLAYHYIEAGDGEKALPYLLQAGDQARISYAYQEAIDKYQRALALLEEKGELDQAARLLMKMGLTHHNAFQFVAARQSYEKGFTLWQRISSYQPVDVPPPAPHPLRLWSPEPETLDPPIALDLWTMTLIDQFFSGLVELSPEMDILPDVAHSWQLLDGGRRYRFSLRDDVTWSDGVQVTAADFEYAWKRALDPATRSEYAGIMYDIVGARAFHQGDTAGSGAVGVHMLDNLTLEVELERPVSYFLQILTMPIARPVPRHTLQGHGSAWTDVDKIVTNGPFLMVARKPGQSMNLKRYAAYHGRFSGNVESIALQFAPSVEAAVKLYQDDQVDRLDLSFLETAGFHRLRQHFVKEYFTWPTLVTCFLSFNHRRPPFNDPRVRQAFAIAIDRERLTDKVLVGRVFAATGGFVPPGMPGHTVGIGLAYDPGEARRLLAESGYPDGQGFPAIECLSGGGAVTMTIQQYLHEQWLENLGIEVNLRAMSLYTLLKRVVDRQPEMWVTSWVADYPDPNSFLWESMQSGVDWGNENYDRLIKEAQSSTDQRRRLTLCQQAERMLIEQAAIVPLTYGRGHVLLKPWVRRYPSSALTESYWKDVIIEPH